MPEINHPRPIITAADQAPSYWLRDALWSVLLSGQATLGQCTVLEQLMPQGNGPPPHVHERMGEGFYIIDGTIDYLVEEQRIHTKTGAAIWIPAGTVHGFTVTSETARVLNFYTPGGFDDHLPYVAAPATARGLPPTGFQDAHDPQAEAAYRDRIRDLHQETSAI